MEKKQVVQVYSNISIEVRALVGLLQVFLRA
ncbi:hypothetical protein CCACVL1_01112 [Corchorus capsularis]|uniref:Uncharacterized protein n=1 Tax=Corchorus capsularis TaxID=210143 RepID=A0A1R3KMV6_COCAP|nr:hypothetical protein CCACVL1_01112 [Corchorus capsularis]